MPGGNDRLSSDFGTVPKSFVNFFSVFFFGLGCQFVQFFYFLFSGTEPKALAA
jgi:hypothetical protein